MPRLRCSIRDVLWLTLVVALALGWWLDKERMAELFAEQERKAQIATDAELRRGLLLYRDSVERTHPVSDVRDLRSSAPSQPFGHFPPD